ALDPFLFEWEAVAPDAQRASLRAGKEVPADVTPGDVAPTARYYRTQYQRKGLTLLITVICCYVSISTLLQTKDEFRFIIPYVELQIHEASLPELREVQKVDERLVVLAKALGARVVTNDYNLNKIAQLQGVEVINLNELANSLKSVALPGEAMSVRLVKAGD